MNESQIVETLKELANLAADARDKIMQELPVEVLYALRDAISKDRRVRGPDHWMRGFRNNPYVKTIN